MLQQLITVVDMTEVLDVMTDECRHRTLVYAESTVSA